MNTVPVLPDSSHLSSKIAVVTGGTDGLGRHPAATLASPGSVVGMEDKLIRAATWPRTALLIAGRFKVEYTSSLGQGRGLTIKHNGHFDNDDLASPRQLAGHGTVEIGPLVQDVVPAGAFPHRWIRSPDLTRSPCFPRSCGAARKRRKPDRWNAERYASRTKRLPNCRTIWSPAACPCRQAR